MDEYNNTVLKMTLINVITLFAVFSLPDKPLFAGIIYVAGFVGAGGIGGLESTSKLDIIKIAKQANIAPSLLIMLAYFGMFPSIILNTVLIIVGSTITAFLVAPLLNFTLMYSVMRVMFISDVRRFITYDLRF